MPRDLDGLADVVVLTVKTAFAPALERLAVLEQRHHELIESCKAMVELRDRIVVIETKAAMPVSPDPAVGELRAKLQALKTLPQPIADAEVSGLKTRVAELDGLRMKFAETAPLLSTLVDVTKDVSALRERMAVVETRTSVPGPAGQDGKPGKDGSNGQDGQPGKDGTDGLGFDDLQTVQLDDRSFTIQAVRGDRVKTIGTARFPGVPIQRGVYLDGQSYDAGDVVTWGGSQWFCHDETTTKPGDGSKAWTLIVKRGRDGKDGRDGQDLVPVVKVGRS